MLPVMVSVSERLEVGAIRNLQEFGLISALSAWTLTKYEFG